MVSDVIFPSFGGNLYGKGLELRYVDSCDFTQTPPIYANTPNWPILKFDGMNVIKTIDKKAKADHLGPLGGQL